MVEVADLVAYSSQAAFVIDGSQRVLAFNKAAEQLLGYRSDEATAITCDELLRGIQPVGGTVCAPHCGGIACLLTCRPYSEPKCFVQRKDGSRTAVVINTIAVPGPTTDPNRPVAVILLSTSDTAASDVIENDSRLHILTLGRFALSLAGCCVPLEQWPRKQAVQLLKFLVVHSGRPVHRERLIEFLWPDAEVEVGWTRLKVTVHFLRRQLREAGLHQDIISTTDSSYVLRQDCVWIDELAFEAAVREGRDHHRTGRVAEAIHSFDRARRLYRGDFMESDLYADWCAEDRERLCELYLESLTALAELHFARGEYAAAAQICHTALVREPCREGIHRLLIRSLIGLNRPDRAVRQFHRCEEILRTELGVTPTAETRAMVAPLLGSAAALARP